MPAFVRPYHPSDLPALYRICGQANDSSNPRPDLAGHYFVGPYATLEPDLCFVVVSGGQPAGYICGTQNVEQFRQTCEAEWFPALRAISASPAGDSPSDDELIAAIHAGIDLNNDVRDYPARLHIVLLPALHRQGWGRRLMQVFLARLRELGCPALHLEVGSGNTGAIAFYDAIGFHRIVDYPGAIEFGMRLGAGAIDDSGRDQSGAQRCVR